MWPFRRKLSSSNAYISPREVMMAVASSDELQPIRVEQFLFILLAVSDDVSIKAVPEIILRARSIAISHGAIPVGSLSSLQLFVFINRSVSEEVAWGEINDATIKALVASLGDNVKLGYGRCDGVNAQVSNDGVMFAGWIVPKIGGYITEVQNAACGHAVRLAE